MNAEKKKLVTMVALLVGFAVVCIVVFGSRSGGARSQSLAAVIGRGEESERESLLDSNPQYLTTVARIARSREAGSYSTWDLRDPMAALIEAGDEVREAKKKEKQAPVTLPYMSFNGIVWDPESPVAMIDGLDLRIGDEIKGARVVEIGIDRVVLSYKSKRFVLTVD